MQTHCRFSSRLGSSARGFTLIELLVASAMSVMIVGTAFIGLINLLQNSSKISINTSQANNLNLALDLIGDDVRSARQINSIEGSTVTTAAAAITASDTTTAFNPPLSSAAGTYVLYLEIPLPSISTSTCATGTDLAGQAPPTIDRVLYDVRPSDGTWKNPYVVYRYGRLQKANGRVDPCTLPQADQVLVEAIAPPTPPAIAPTCTSPSLQSGMNGFWACVATTGITANITLNSTIPDSTGTARTYFLESQVSTRGI